MLAFLITGLDLRAIKFWVAMSMQVINPLSAAQVVELDGNAQTENPIYGRRVTYVETWRLESCIHFEAGHSVFSLQHGHCSETMIRSHQNQRLRYHWQIFTFNRDN